jgi:hypothetical protein
MKTLTLLVSLALFMSRALPAQQETARDAAARQPNAALKYWQAYASMSRSLNARTREKVDSYAETAIDETAVKAVAQCEYAIVLVHKAAKSERCEWEVDLEPGPAATIEHYEPVRALARLMCLSARRHFEQGLPASGVRDCLALFALGRHMGTDDLSVCRLNQCAIETLAIVTLARYLPKLDGDELSDLRQKLAELPEIRETQMDVPDLKDGIAAVKVRRQLLHAAIAVQQNGPEAVKQFKDPYADGPFAYRPLAAGFELSSKLHKYVRVTVGRNPED